MRVFELETLFTGNIAGHEKAVRTVEARNKALAAKPTVAKLDMDVRTALASVGRLEDRARTADVSVPVDADTSSAEDKIDGLADKAEGAGADGGQRSGKALAAGIVGALAAVPIAGAVVGIAKAAGDAVVQGFQDGLAVEVRADTLAARTGLDEATVGRLGAAAGESYADNFGESIEANMDTARRAVDTGLLDPKATQRDAEQVISSLSGVADILEEDVARVSRSSAQLLRTGLAKNAQEAFDLIVAGQQAGLNVSEDWLDTIDEYATQWRDLGLTSGDVLGLLSQGVKAGARDTDIAADSLKEFSIRARDGSATTKAGYDAIGLSAEDMAAKIAAGGDSARDALDQTLDGLRAIEDPVARDAAAVALFGTQAEDLGKALYAMDLDTAASQFDQLEGAADRALTTLGDNSAGKVASAQRSIEVAADGIKGALAEAFAPQLGEFAEEISQNREMVVQFLLDVANGGLDAGRALIEGAAGATEGFGDFVGETGPAVLGLIQSILEGLDSIPGLDLGDALDDFKAMREEAEASFAEFDSGSEDAADAIRTNLIENGLDPAQRKLNELGSGLVSGAALSDATNRLADDIASVGYAADGSELSIKTLNGRIDTSTESGKRLDTQVRRVKKSLEEQAGAAVRNGESQKQVRQRAEQARQAFIDQVTAMGLTAKQAERLAARYGLIPKRIATQATLDASAAQTAASNLWSTLQTIDGKTVTASVALKQYGQAALAAGGRLPGFPTGGRLPGNPPADPTRDNLLGVDEAGMPRVRVRSREWVVSQPASDYYGDAIMASLNARQIPRELFEALPGLAAGGAVASAQRELAQQLRLRKNAAARVHRNRANDRRDNTSLSARALRDAEERLDEIDEKIADTRARLERLQDERNDTTRALRRGDIREQVTGGLSGALSQIDSMYELAASGDLTRAQSSRLRDTAKDAEKALTTLYRQAEKAEGALAKARDRYEELFNVRESVRSNLVGGFGLADVAGTVNPWSGQEAPATGQQLKAAAEAYKGKVQKYASLLKRLTAAKAGPAILQELGRYGIEQGIPIAEALLTLPKGELADLAHTYDAISFYAGNAGEYVTDAISPGGASAAAAAVKQAEATVASIDKRIGSWATRIGNATAKALGIKTRATGGDIRAGAAYKVGEVGEELFFPDQSGYMLDATKTANVLAGTRVVNNFNITNVHPINEAPSVTASKTARSLAGVGRR